MGGHCGAPHGFGVPAESPCALQVFDAVSGGVDAASPIVQNRALRQENATLQRQLALLREADDNEFDQLHDYLGTPPFSLPCCVALTCTRPATLTSCAGAGHLHVRLAKLEQDYAALESRQAETHASPEQHDQLALVPAPVVEEAGAAHEVAALVHRVAPSLERLPGIEAQLGELAELKAEMQAAVRALQQARAQPQQPPADAGQVPINPPFKLGARGTRQAAPERLFLVPAASPDEQGAARTAQGGAAAAAGSWRPGCHTCTRSSR